jgi:glucokinase
MSVEVIAPSPAPARVAPEQAAIGLVADIGGTHVRFATAAIGARRVNNVRQFAVRDFASLEDALTQYRCTTPGVPADLRHAALAVATRLDGDHVHITNNPWTFSVDSVRRSHGFERALVLNDLAAVGYAVGTFEPGDIRTLGAKPVTRPFADGTYAVVGVGTGLGVACVMVQDGKRQVLASEGGHVSFAPIDTACIEVKKWLARSHPRVSAERIISGQGLEAIHAALAARDGRTPMSLSAEDITARAKDASDASCVESVEVFCRCLGAFAGDVVLMFGAWRGLFLAGGMLQHFDPDLLVRNVRATFDAKGRFADDMREVPMEMILRSDAGLIGAAQYLSAETAG